jgi:hypothetical protein
MNKKYAFRVQNQNGTMTQSGEDFNKLTVLPLGYSVTILDVDQCYLPVSVLTTQEALDGYLEGLQRAAAWKPEVQELKTFFGPRSEFGQETLSTIAHLNNVGKDIGLAIQNLGVAGTRTFGPINWTPSVTTLPYIPPAIGRNDAAIPEKELPKAKSSMAEMTGTKEGFAENYNQRGDAKHYQDVVPGMQYMEMMQYMLANFTGVEAHLMGQIYKYLMRCGKKDATLQELTKVHWYLEFLIAWYKNGCKPFTEEEKKKLLMVELYL